MRFRRRITIAPGLRLNLSGSGASVSLGPRGASLTFGKNGVWGNTSIPGTGLYRRQKLTPSRSAFPGTSRHQARAEYEADLLAAFHSAEPRIKAPLDGGIVELTDSNNAPLPKEVQEAAWKHLRPSLIQHMVAHCGSLRSGIESLGSVHHDTPDPAHLLQFQPTSFIAPEPSPPASRPYHWLFRLLPWHRQKVDEENDLNYSLFQSSHREWLDARATHDRSCHQTTQWFRRRETGNTSDLEQFLAWHIARLKWPQDTSVDLSLSDGGTRVSLDVDFPEIEDFPSGIPEVSMRARSIRIKPFSESARRRLYAAHIHAVLFRLIGECFHAASHIKEIAASGYSQRSDRATGVIRDHYLISVIVKREAWSGIDFSRLQHVDPIEALAQFTIRRKMTKTGLFSEIEPFG